VAKNLNRLFCFSLSLENLTAIFFWGMNIGRLLLIVEAVLKMRYDVHTWYSLGGNTHSTADFSFLG
jgi:hypothetical protein